MEAKYLFEWWCDGTIRWVGDCNTGPARSIGMLLRWETTSTDEELHDDVVTACAMVDTWSLGEDWIP